jgi:copper chaperone CopZ
MMASLFSLKRIRATVAAMVVVFATFSAALASSTKSFRVEGMTCGGCEEIIRKKMKAVEGFESCEFRKEGKQDLLDVTVSTSTAPDLKTAQAALKGTDYKLFDVTADSKAKRK